MEESETTELCHNCKCNIPKNNFALHAAFCEKNLMLCPICSEPIDKKIVAKHIEVDHAYVPCDLCGMKFEKWMLITHAESCPKRKVPCQYCNAAYFVDTIEEHLDFCGSRTENCIMCHNRVTIKKMEEHLQENCIRRIIHCMHCNIELPYLMMENHEDHCEVRPEMCCYCKNSVPRKRIKEHEGSCPKRLIPCKSCGGNIPSDQIKEHYELCQSKIEKCTFCQNPVKSRHLKGHMKDFCPKRLVPCSICGENFAFDELEDHLDSCDSQTDKCGFCQKSMQIEFLQDHLESCPEKPFSCQYCRIKFPLAHLTQHYKECNPEAECPVCHLAIKMKDLNLHIQNHETKRSSKPPKNDVSQQSINQNISTSQSMPVIASPEESNVSVTSLSNVGRRSGSVPVASEKSEEYKKRYGDCPKCKKSIPWVNMDLHVSVCYGSSDNCHACGEFVSDEDMKEHYLNRCSRRLVKGLQEGNDYNSVKIEGKEKNHPKDSPASWLQCSRCKKIVLSLEMDSHVCNLAKSTDCQFCDDCNQFDFSSSKRKRSWEVAGHEKHQKCKKNLFTEEVRSGENTVRNKESLLKLEATDEFVCEHCSESFPVKDKDKHQTVCPYGYECPSCQERMPFGDQGFHQRYSCKVVPSFYSMDAPKKAEVASTVDDVFSAAGKIIVHCPYCSATILENQLAKHVEECSSHYYECQLCMEKVLKEDKINHESGACKMLEKCLEGKPSQQNEMSLSMLGACGRDPKSNPDQPVRCPYCFEKYEDTISVHLKSCHASYTCELCSLELPVKHKEMHENYECIVLKKIYYDEKTASHYNGTHAKSQQGLPYCSNCKTIFNVSIQTHNKMCPYRKETCKDCGEQYAKIEHSGHIRSCNPPRKEKKGKKLANNGGAIPKHSASNKVKCEWCDKSTTGELLPFHLKRCECKIVKCDICDERMPLKDIEKHGLKVHCGNESEGVQNSGKIHEKSILGKFGKLKNFLWKRDFSLENEDEPFSCSKENFHEYVPPTAPYPANSFSNDPDEKVLPCEFCGELFSMNEIIEHGTGCNPNLTSFTKALEKEAWNSERENVNRSHESSQRFSYRGSRTSVAPGEFLDQAIKIAPAEPKSQESVESVWASRNKELPGHKNSGVVRSEHENSLKIKSGENSNEIRSSNRAPGCKNDLRIHLKGQVESSGSSSDSEEETKISSSTGEREENLFLSLAAQLKISDKDTDNSRMDVDEGKTARNIQLEQQRSTVPEHVPLSSQPHYHMFQSTFGTILNSSEPEQNLQNREFNFNEHKYESLMSYHSEISAPDQRSFAESENRNEKMKVLSENSSTGTSLGEQSFGKSENRNEKIKALLEKYSSETSFSADQLSEEFLNISLQDCVSPQSSGVKPMNKDESQRKSLKERVSHSNDIENLSESSGAHQQEKAKQTLDEENLLGCSKEYNCERNIGQESTNLRSADSLGCTDVEIDEVKALSLQTQLKLRADSFDLYRNKLPNGKGVEKSIEYQNSGRAYEENEGAASIIERKIGKESNRDLISKQPKESSSLEMEGILELIGEKRPEADLKASDSTKSEIPSEATSSKESARTCVKYGENVFSTSHKSSRFSFDPNNKVLEKKPVSEDLHLQGQKMNIYNADSFEDLWLKSKKSSVFEKTRLLTGYDADKAIEQREKLISDFDANLQGLRADSFEDLCLKSKKSSVFEKTRLLTGSDIDKAIEQRDKLISDFEANLQGPKGDHKVIYPFRCVSNGESKDAESSPICTKISSVGRVESKGTQSSPMFSKISSVGEVESKDTESSAVLTEISSVAKVESKDIESPAISAKTKVGEVESKYNEASLTYPRDNLSSVREVLLRAGYDIEEFQKFLNKQAEEKPSPDKFLQAESQEGRYAFCTETAKKLNCKQLEDSKEEKSGTNQQVSNFLLSNKASCDVTQQKNRHVENTISNDENNQKHKANGAFKIEPAQIDVEAKIRQMRANLEYQQSLLRRLEVEHREQESEIDKSVSEFLKNEDFIRARR